MTDQPNRGYIFQVQHEQQQYAQSLIAENERLRTLAAALESDKRQAEDQARAATAELQTLRAQLETVAAESDEYAGRYQQIEMQSANLANLYVASYQLHTSTDRETVLRVIQEIVVNLVGSEQVAIFETTDGRMFTMTSSFGVDASRMRVSRFRLGDGPIGSHVATGRIYVNPNAGGEHDHITACIPLAIGTTVIGAILIFRLLDHKPALLPVDHEIFDLLSVHASSALYCNTVRATLAGAAS